MFDPEVLEVLQKAPLEVMPPEPSPFLASWGTWAPVRTSPFQYMICVGEEGALGFRLEERGGAWRVIAVEPTSHARLSGVDVDDELLALTPGVLVVTDLTDSTPSVRRPLVEKGSPVNRCSVEATRSSLSFLPSFAPQAVNGQCVQGAPLDGLRAAVEARPLTLVFKRTPLPPPPPQQEHDASALQSQLLYLLQQQQQQQQLPEQRTFDELGATTVHPHRPNDELSPSSLLPLFQRHRPTPVHTSAAKVQEDHDPKRRAVSAYEDSLSEPTRLPAPSAAERAGAAYGESFDRRLLLPRTSRAGAAGALLELIRAGADPQRAPRVSGDALTKLSRAAASLLVAWRQKAARPTCAGSLPCGGLPGVYVVHNFVGRREAHILRKIFESVKPVSSLRCGGNRAGDCALAVITRRAADLFKDRWPELRKSHFFGTRLVGLADDDDKTPRGLDVVQLANHNIVVRSSDGSVLLTENSAAFSVDPAPAPPTPLGAQCALPETNVRLCVSFFLDFRAPACITIPK